MISASTSLASLPYFNLLISLIICAILGSSLVEYKIYAGVLVLGGLLSIGILEFLKGSDARKCNFRNRSWV